MAVKYVNRKNLVFYLNVKKDKDGNDEYFFSRDNRKNVLNELPDGYQIHEDSGSGKVTLKKID